jgi:hypothetical protein
MPPFFVSKTKFSIFVRYDPHFVQNKPRFCKNSAVTYKKRCKIGANEHCLHCRHQPPDLCMRLKQYASALGKGEISH